MSAKELNCFEAGKLRGQASLVLPPKSLFPVTDGNAIQIAAVPEGAYFLIR
jgi:hypothetical protein